MKSILGHSGLLKHPGWFLLKVFLIGIFSCFSCSFANTRNKADQPERKLYQVSNKDFDLNELPPQTRALYQAFLNGWDAQTFSPDFRGGLFSNAYPDKVNLYGIRGSKVYQDYIKAFIEEGIQDPRLIEMVYELVKPVTEHFETKNIPWPEGKPLPGAAKTIKGVLVVSDEWSEDYNEPYGTNRGQKSAWARRHAWGYPGDDAWGNNPTAEERKSKKFKTAQETGRKKILILTPWAPYTGIALFGTNHHPLDQQLATQHLFWAGYMLDVNRHLNPKYGAIADSLWDYKINHWEIDAPGIMGERHPVYKFYSNASTLHHANDAHTSLYHANMVWHTLREGKPRAEDVTALAYLMQTILDDIYLIPVPAQAPDYHKYKGAAIANYSHWNQATNMLLGKEINYLPGDVTYSSYRAGTLLSLMHGKVKGVSGRMLTDEHMEALSNMFALIVEQGAPVTGQDYLLPNEVSGYSASSREPQKTTVLFNNGNKASGFYYGGDKAAKLQPNEARRAMGGTYLSWDKTGRQIAFFQQRGKNNSDPKTRFDVAAVLTDPADPMNRVWEWLGAYILLSLRRPDIDLSKPEVITSH